MHPDADLVTAESSPAEARPNTPGQVAGPPRTRRALLAGALGGLAGAVAAALGRPMAARAAAGDPLVLGQTNYAGGSSTRLNATSSGGAFWMTQNGFGSGVRGDSAKGHGGVFTTQHVDRYGLLAQHAPGGGTGAAIRAEGGLNVGVSAAGGWGVDASGSGVGVRAISDSWGVYGEGGTKGVHGLSAGGIGVHGSTSTGWAGYFTGNTHVAGTLSKSAGTFRIDHPLDPANKLLQHSFVESPDMKNVYDGLVTTDAEGEATVELPAWFEALNQDVRYQLTGIGAEMPALHVKAKVARGRFVIAGAAPGQEVSWQLTGIRRDAWAEAHRIEVELDKPEGQKGRYLNPLEHGQPESMGVDWELRREAQDLSSRVSPA